MPGKKSFRTMEVMKDLQGFFRKGERKKIYECCSNYRDKVLIRLLWKTGRRVSEVLSLKVNHIDFENSQILWAIKKKKTKDYRRWKPVDEGTLNLLAYCIKTFELKENDYIISGGSPNKSLTRQRVFFIVRQLCKKAGIKYVGVKKPHPHHFRHSFAVDIARKAKSPSDVRKLQLLMEHSSLDMTEQYLQFGSVDLKELIEKLDDED